MCHAVPAPTAVSGYPARQSLPGAVLQVLVHDVRRFRSRAQAQGHGPDAAPKGDGCRLQGAGATLFSVKERVNLTLALCPPRTLVEAACKLLQSDAEGRSHIPICGLPFTVPCNTPRRRVGPSRNDRCGSPPPSPHPAPPSPREAGRFQCNYCAAVWLPRWPHLPMPPLLNRLSGGMRHCLSSERGRAARARRRASAVEKVTKADTTWGEKSKGIAVKGLTARVPFCLYSIHAGNFS